jgi:calcineurin-like phosphoesterase family protein
MSQWFFSADWHINHANIIKYSKRPFMTREEEALAGMADRGSIGAKELRISQESLNRMNDAIFDNTNAVVGYDDTLVIGGDLCWLPHYKAAEAARRIRDRINCRNVYLIWGNHDNERHILAPLFKGVYDQYTFNVGGQNIFMSHYPCRSWDRAHHGSWMLYGHVHNLYWREDNGLLMPYQEKVYSEGFRSILDKLGISGMLQDDAIKELLEVVASTNGVDLTLDIGVDNVRPGIPFGTPWSMDDLRDHFGKKKVRWQARSDKLRKLAPPSTLKGGNPTADPKF